MIESLFSYEDAEIMDGAIQFNNCTLNRQFGTYNKQDVICCIEFYILSGVINFYAQDGESYKIVATFYCTLEVSENA